MDESDGLRVKGVIGWVRRELVGFIVGAVDETRTSNFTGGFWPGWFVGFFNVGTP